MWTHDLGRGIEMGVWYSPFVAYDLDGDAIGAIGEIVGAAAVVATIFYLSAQVRQNSRSVEENVRARRLTAADATVEEFSRYRDRVSQPDLAALVVKGRDSYQGLSDAERLQFDAIMDEYMFAHWSMFMRRREGAQARRRV